MTLQPVSRPGEPDDASRALASAESAESAEPTGLTLSGERAPARPAPRRPWTGQDFVWWNTAAVLTAVRNGRRPNPVSPVVDPVRCAFAAD